MSNDATMSDSNGTVASKPVRPTLPKLTIPKMTGYIYGQRHMADALDNLAEKNGDFKYWASKVLTKKSITVTYDANGEHFETVLNKPVDDPNTEMSKDQIISLVHEFDEDIMPMLNELTIRSHNLMSRKMVRDLSEQLRSEIRYQHTSAANQEHEKLRHAVSGLYGSKMEFLFLVALKWKLTLDLKARAWDIWKEESSGEEYESEAKRYFDSQGKLIS